MSDAFDLTTTPVHLGLGSTAEPLHGFSWDPAYLEAYEARTAGDGAEGRLVTLSSFDGPWPRWEVHPDGAEVVVCVTGRATLHQEVEGEVRTVVVGPGEAVVNPPGTWHTADVDEP